MEKIIINGKEFNLNTDRAKELGVLTPVKPPFVSPKIGESYIQTAGMYKDCVYVLAHCGSYNVALLNTGLIGDNKDVFSCAGGLWSTPVKVSSLVRITETEWKEICGGWHIGATSFKLVKTITKLQ